MNFKDLIIVGVALAMDAVGVSISIGVNSAIKRINKPNKVSKISVGIILANCPPIMPPIIPKTPNLIPGFTILSVDLLCL